MSRIWKRVVFVLALAAIPAGSARAGLLPSKEAWLGRQYLLRGQWERAAQAFQRAVQRGYPSLAEALKRGHPPPAEMDGLGYAALKAGEFDLAAQTYEELCRRYPRTASFQVNRGLAYAYQGWADLIGKAREAFEKALEINPRDPDALLNLAVLLHRYGDFPAARGYYEKAAAAAPRKSGYFLIELADLERDHGDLDAAYFLYQRALQRSPEFPQTLLGMARLLFIRGGNSGGDRARQYYDDAIFYARQFIDRTSDRSGKRRWRSEINEANRLIQQAESRKEHPVSPAENGAPLRITLLWPPESQVQQHLILPSDHLGIIGVVSGGGGVGQVTVNGVYPDYLPVDPGTADEVQELIQGKEPLTGELRMSKIAGLLSKSAGLLSKSADLGSDVQRRSPGANAAGLALFYAEVPLTGEETPIRIAALDIRSQVATRSFTVYRASPEPRPALAPVPEAGKTWALFVGVDHYRIPGVPSLLYPASDARRLYDLMCDPNHGGIALSSHQAFLLPDEAGAQPTRANIEDRLRQIASGVQPADTVLLFFSGHGCTTKDGSTYLLTSDSEEGRLDDTAFDQVTLARLLEPLRKARHVVVFLDACHAAGVLGQTVGGASLAGDPTANQKLAGGLRGCDVLVSCGKEQSSYEDPIGLQAGVFAYYLAEGLAGAADANDDGVIQADELATYVENKVRGWCLPPQERGQKAAEEIQSPQTFPEVWTEDFPLATTPIGAAREALARLGSTLSAVEIQDAEEGLKSDKERSILADWLLALDASVEAPAGTPSSSADTSSGSVTLAAYRQYRDTLRNRPESPEGQLYRFLPPAEALLAVQHLPPMAPSPEAGRGGT